jgi:hypothetical protein
MEVQYDKEYKFGNTKIYVIAPKINEKEKQKRWQNVCDIASTIIKQLIYKGGENNGTAVYL